MVIMKLLTLSLGFIVLLAGCAAPSQTSETAVEPTGVKHEIEISSAGFSPRQSSMNLGDTLVFVNKDVAQHWPASDIHPTHNVYPEKGGCLGSKFDACKGLNEGQKYEFTFLHSGNWCFHDHLNPGLTGCVDVQ